MSKFIPKFQVLEMDGGESVLNFPNSGVLFQEIAKLITMDLLMTIASILVVDFFRSLWVRHCNLWWCWNLETTFVS
jgi:hypothetical protein